MSKKAFKVKCIGLDDFGLGIVKVDNSTYFVNDLLPGEEAEISTIYQYGKVKEVILEKRLTTSNDRIKPACKYYPNCGGCQLMHLKYEKQLEYKQKKVKDLIHKFAHLDVDVDKTIGLSDPTRFRNKVQKPVKLNNKKEIITGFYKPNSHDLVSISDCLIETELSNKITNTLLKLFKKYHYLPYDEDRRSGDIRHILIKTSSFYNQALVTLVTTSHLKGINNFSKELISIHKEIVGVVLNINTRHTNVILGEKEIDVYGHKKIVDKLFDNNFLISSKSFYQTNFKQVEVLYKLAIDKAKLKDTDTVLDAYCGTGTIGLSLANKVKRVVGVEIVKDAIVDAISNAKNNNIKNATFICDDCTKYLLSTKDKFDIIILDPPRKGSTVEFINAAMRMKTRSIVYISCDPVTLARDLNYFKEKYNIESVTPVDMFPNSLHVETVVLLTIKD